jgi:hypothetical protein
MDIYFVLPDSIEIKVSMIIPPRVNEIVSLSRVEKRDYCDPAQYDFKHKLKQYVVKCVTWFPMSSNYTFAHVVLEEIGEVAA